MPELRLFASAREAAGTSSLQVEAGTVGQVLRDASARFGEPFAAVLARSRVWVNGQPAADDARVAGDDVVAVLPPVSGGAGDLAARRRATTDEPTAAVPIRRPPTPAFHPAPPPPPPPPTTTGVRGAVAEALGVAPVPEPREEPTPLAVVPEVKGPHGRLGALWALLTVFIVVFGRGWLAAWMAPLAMVAALNLCKAWHSQRERPVVFVAASGATALPVAAVAGVDAMTAVMVLVCVLAFVARLRTPTRFPTRDIGLTFLLAVSVGLAAASPVLLRGLGRAPCLVLLALMAAYDVGSYLVGTGASTAWEGPVAGVASMLPVTIVVAVVVVPPFSGARPWLLAAVAALLAPLGPLAASALLGDGTARAPALRRLDSLLLAGPIWALAAAALLR